MAKRVSVINFKGGVGKTTLAFHLATGLARYYNGTRVLLIDIDHQSSLSILCIGPHQWQTATAAGQTVDMVFQHFTVPGSPLPGSNLVIGNAIRGGRYPTLDLVPASLHLDDTEIELAAAQTGNPILSEWTKRTLLCQWIETTGIDNEYDYIIIDCPPATKIVSQNAIALSHGYIVPVVPEAVMERGAPHLVDLIRDRIDAKLRLLARFGTLRPTYVDTTQLVGLVVTRITTSRGSSGYTNDHTEHLDQLRRQWGASLLTPYIVSGTGVSESLTSGLPVYDHEYTPGGNLTQNVGKRGLPEQYRRLVANLKARIDAL